MEEKKVFYTWCDQYDIHPCEALNLITSTGKSLNRLESKENYVSTKFFLYLLTGLADFELSESELLSYQQFIKLNQNGKQRDEIVRDFVLNWQQKKELPPIDQRVYVLSEDDAPHKFVGLNIKKFKGYYERSVKDLLSYISSKRNNIQPKISEGAKDPLIMELTLKLIHIIEGDMLSTYLIQNGSGLLQLQTILRITTGDNPGGDLKKIRNTLNIFSNEQ